ncbi:MAG: hypothetical protein E6J14_15185 [Chloroflexi bacterium]|nr:MAG: hypothetical protein E6J14_15185 [Chloroflexota bacterium]
MPAKVRVIEGRILDDFLSAKDEQCRTELRNAVRGAVLHISIEAAATEERWHTFENRLQGVSWWILIALGGLAAITMIWGWFLPLCAATKPPSSAVAFCPGGEPHRGGVLEVAGLGALGGLVSTVMALRRRSVSVPDYVRATESWLRLPLGALVAVLGVLVLQSGLAAGIVTHFEPQTTTMGVLTWATALGFSSLLVARLVDARVAHLAGELAAASSARSGAQDRRATSDDDR